MLTVDDATFAASATAAAVFALMAVSRQAVTAVPGRVAPAALWTATVLCATSATMQMARPEWPWWAAAIPFWLGLAVVAGYTLRLLVERRRLLATVEQVRAERRRLQPPSNSGWN